MPLGAKFSLSAVTAVTENLSDEEIGTLSGVDIEFDSEDDAISQLGSSINELEDEGLWEKESKDADIRVFGHDKIQSAAFDLIPTDKRDTFRGKIGSLLMENLDPEVLETHLFEIVSLRNCAMDAISDEGQRTELAKMNLRAGMKVRPICTPEFQPLLVFSLFICFPIHSLIYQRHQRMQHLILQLFTSKQAGSSWGPMVGIQINKPCLHSAARVQTLVSFVVILIR